jgi:hypothetical protein
LLCGCQGDAEIIVCLGVIRARLQRRLQVPHGFGQAPFLGQRGAQVVMRFGGAGVALQRLPVMCDRFVQPALGGQSVPQIVVGFGIVGHGRERLPVLRHGFVHPSRSRQTRAEVAVRPRIVDTHGEGFGPLPDGGLIVALLRQGGGDVELAVEVARWNIDALDAG